MKLKDCEIGKVVVTDEGEIGHIIGFTYNLCFSVLAMNQLTKADLAERTIPLVKFPMEERAINHANLELLR